MVWARVLTFIVLDHRSLTLWLVSKFAGEKVFRAYTFCLYVLLIRLASIV